MQLLNTGLYNTRDVYLRSQSSSGNQFIFPCMKERKKEDNKKKKSTLYIRRDKKAEPTLQGGSGRTKLTSMCVI